MTATDRTSLASPAALAHDDDGPPGHDLGLAHDLPTLLSRRRALSFLGGLGAVATLAACGAGQDSTATSSTSSTTSSAQGGPPGGGPGGPPGAASNVDVGEGEIPEETAGPYPATAPTVRTCCPRAASSAATSARASATPPVWHRGCR